MKRMLTLLLLGFAFAVSPAHAGMIATEDTQAVAERERLKALVARPEVAKALEQKGVLPRDAASRVDAMTDAEVRQLVGRIDALPAGGLSTNDWLLIIVIILLVIIIL